MLGSVRTNSRIYCQLPRSSGSSSTRVLLNRLLNVCRISPLFDRTSEICHLQLSIILLFTVINYFDWLTNERWVKSQFQGCEWATALFNCPKIPIDWPMPFVNQYNISSSSYLNSNDRKPFHVEKFYSFGQSPKFSLKHNYTVEVFNACHLYIWSPH